MSYTTDQLSAMMDNLTARVAAVDGIGLPVGQSGRVAQVQAKQVGFAVDLKQLTTLLQQKLTTVNTTVASYLAAVRGLTGAV